MHYCYAFFFFLQIQSQSLSLLKCLLFSLYVKLYNIFFWRIQNGEREKKSNSNQLVYMLFVRYMSFSFSYAPVFFPSKFSLACIIVQVLLKFATSIRLVLFLFLHQYVLLICFWYFFFLPVLYYSFFSTNLYIYIYYAV